MRDMKTWMIAGALLLALAPAASAQAKKTFGPGQGIEWQGDWEAAVKEATARNVPIVLTIHKDLCPRCKAMEEGTLRNAKVIELSKTFVNVVAHKDTEHGSTETLVGREKVKLCNDYGTIPCEAHVKAWSAVGHFINGSFGTPTTIFCDPAGKELFRTEGDPGAGDMAKKMTEALAKVDGEKIPSTTWTQATQLQADAQAAFDKGDVRKAIELWTKIAKLKGNSFRTLALEGYKKAGDKGAEALKAALAIDNVADRKTELRKIADDYKGLNVSADARKELEALK
jgi:hypothetical protein